MRPMRRTTIRLAIVLAAAAGTLLAGATGAAAATNRVAFANLALNQMLTLRGGMAITADAAGAPGQVWDQVYATHIPTVPGFSSPYQLRNRETNTCLQDVGEGRVVLAMPCELAPRFDSAQLWSNHRLPDRTVNGRDYYFRFNQFSDRVLSAAPTSPDAEVSRVISADAEPISKGGGADHQLWVMLAGS